MSSTSNFRKRLDALIQNGKAIKCSAETTLAWRSLQMAKAWLGKALGYQGNASPYTVAEKISEIPPTADVADVPLFVMCEATGCPDHLSSVNQMRDRIQSEIESIEGVMPTEERQRHCYQNCLDHLVEARMWYGFELQELREMALESRNAIKMIPTEIAQYPVTTNEAVAGARHVDGVSEDYLIPDTPLDGGSVLDEKPIQDVSTAGLLDAKISENENKDSKKEQPRAPKKKG